MSPVPFVADAASLAERLAADFEAEARRAHAAGGRFTIALSGGSVATTCFPRLAALPIDWQRCEFFWADERAVAPADAESNYGLARLLWLDRAHVPSGRVHRMAAEDLDLEGSASRYADVITQIAGRPPRLDYVIVGVGPDGHVASLFPGHPLLHEEQRMVAAVHDSPKPPPRRMTLTMPVLAGAARLVVAAFGASKAAVIQEALENPESTLPVAMVLRRAQRPLVLLEKSSEVL